MHVAEIDFIAEQALIQSIIQGKACGPTLRNIRNVIAGYRPNRFVPLLFGGNGRLNHDIKNKAGSRISLKN
jgi:hypothetical protein